MAVRARAIPLCRARGAALAPRRPVAHHRAKPLQSEVMRLNPELTAYIFVTLLVLWSAAHRYAPVAPRSGEAQKPVTREAPGGLVGCTTGYVYDGDTVELICGNRRDRARLAGYDAPETHEPGCAAEATLGARATDRLRGLLRAATPAMTDLGIDKYGRRLIRLRLPGGEDVADRMIAEGLAVAYDGAQRIDWCARIAASGGAKWLSP
ncbi:hypothetical protein D2N39_03055 [Gemmobacter lutimaris]|uniref:TNase-like domain-containing protein n=2 Tax=Gemmobacter lutimaris TaxID=2306023 RepID=A0A398BWM7_9RHOB|nr:hypothetical protein D2N39_03055 [Gemmobacter lutimaris]